jgi:hypothetical protein
MVPTKIIRLSGGKLTMGYVKLQNGAADTVMQLTAKLWTRLGGQRPTYDDTINIVLGSIDDAMLDAIIARYHANNSRMAVGE